MKSSAMSLSFKESLKGSKRFLEHSQILSNT